MTPELALGAAAGLAVVLALLVAVLALRRQSAAVERLRLLEERVLAGQRTEAETVRASLAAAERALSAAQAQGGAALRGEVAAAIEALRTSNDARLSDIARTLADQLAALRDATERRLAAIQASVNEQLHAAVEKQMATSFARVTEQFAQVQKAMGEMQAVGAQIGDLRRLFANVKTRGGWGEAQLRALLDDILPPGTYDTNWKPHPDRDDTVEFAVIMPMRGESRPRLPVDAKFPLEDYERLLSAQEAADAPAERAARLALAARVRAEARKIAEKYIVHPATVEFAVLYLPTDGLYAEVARIDGLIDELARLHRVLVLGPTLLPALLRTIQLGHVTLALEQKADEVRALLGAARTEMGKMDAVIDRLARQAGTFSNTIQQMKTRTGQIQRKLRGVEALDPEAAAALIGPADDAAIDEADPPPEVGGG